jgi:MarR family transcriptional regulator, 2-MHQ and catechol-resistance regulon repressor
MKNKSPEGVHVWLVFIKAFHAIGKLVMADLQESGLIDSDFRVLEVLLHKGPLPVNVIGPKVWLTPGSISVAVDRLHARGLVSRMEDSADRRIRMVDLTPEGRALIEPVFSRHAEFMEKIVAVLSPAERAQLEGMLKKIGRHAETMGSRET